MVHLNKEDKYKTMKEVHRILKNDGILNIWIQNRYSFPYIKYMKDIIKTSFDNKKFIKDFAYWNNRCWWYPSKNEMSLMLSNNGFNIIENNNYFSRWLNFIAKKDKF